MFPIKYIDNNLVRKAVRSITQSDSRGLLHVIDELRREDTPISRNIADHIDSFTDYDFAHLLFSDGTVENAISLDNQLNIIQVDDLVLNNQKRLRDLENGQCLLQDLYGRVGVVQIHPVFEELLHAFDTRPPVQRNEVE